MKLRGRPQRGRSWLRTPTIQAPAATLACLAMAALAPGCFSMRSSAGGGQVSTPAPRTYLAEDVALPGGYTFEPVSTGLTFPSGVTFDEAGRVYVVETGYAYGEVWTTPKLLRIEEGGGVTEIARGGDNGPWNGVVHHEGVFYIAEGGRKHGGKILRVDPSGEITALIEGLPSRGDHHVNGPVAGPDGWLYFAIGTATNSGVVGEDNVKFGWVRDAPDFHDVPCEDVVLTGETFRTENVLPDSENEVDTSPFSPFGVRLEPGSTVRGRVPCSGAVLRIRPEGGEPELVAWGFRNPFGLAFSPEGRLYVSDNSYDVRGSRPVYGTGDLLWAVEPGVWYGWPDFHGPRRVDDEDHFQAPGNPAPRLLLASHPGVPPRPAAIFEVHASADGMDFSESDSFGHRGDLFVAEFGDQAPTVGKVLAPVGYKVVRVDVKTGLIEDFLANRGKRNGPASALKTGGLERPVAVRFDPSGEALYVVDFGIVRETRDGTKPEQGTGVLWRVRREPRTLP